MILPLPLPDWLPWWVQLATLIAALLFGMMFLLMPFAVFGVKGRLDLLEARLDEIQGEIRSLSLRLPEPDRDDDAMPRMAASSSNSADRPPIPPAPRDRPLQPGASRTEPRLY